jgi:hypothetical protein
MPDTLRGIDDLIRSNLETFAAYWFWRLIAFTAVVAFGLFLELRAKESNSSRFFIGLIHRVRQSTLASL